MDHHHHSHSHHHHPDEEYPPPPPPPSQVTGHVHHTSHSATPPPPPPTHHSTTSHHSDLNQPPPPVVSHHITSSHDSHHQTPPPPVVASVQHVSHTSATTPHQPHVSSSLPHHVDHHKQDPLANKPTVKVYSKAKIDFSLTIRDGQVILAPSNPSDHFQHWVKDEKYSTKVKDEEGFPAFALVNKATGQAMKHSIGATHPVQLIPYDADHLDESILWTESRDLGDSYRTIRMVNNIRLNVDAFNGDKEHGGVRNGTKIVLWEWVKGDNQRWKIVPYCKSLNIF